MNLINETDSARQAGRSLSERLGNLAATSHAMRPETAFSHLDTAAPAISPRLSWILNHFRQQARTREQMKHKLLAEEFMTGS
jgi:hypothetical protein